MRIFYFGKNTSRKRELLAGEGDLLLLGFDRWDDYDYKTTFPVVCRMNGAFVELDAIKILIAGQKISFAYLDRLIEGGWNGEFPVPDTNYISVPQSVTFYEQVDGHLGHDITLDVAEKFRDASYMVWILEDAVSRDLTDTEGFRVSLQRERGAKSAYLTAWKLFNHAGFDASSFGFGFKDESGEVQHIRFNFDSDTVLPHDINVLIGPNGVGKSQTLMQMILSWLASGLEEEDDDAGFAKDLDLNQLVVVSYSPFERYPVDVSNLKVQQPKRRDGHIYRYFGLRGRAITKEKNGQPVKSIRLSQQWPKINAAESLVSCVADDQRYGAIKDWSAKVETMARVLQGAIDFDYAAVVIEGFKNEAEFFGFSDQIPDDAIIRLPQTADEQKGNRAAYIPIDADRVSDLVVEKISKYLRSTSGVVFLKNGAPVELSSGQRLFSFMVINILGAIRRNSLILIDEPELFLHPSLEISFISMLKDILSSFKSKAVLATHSLVTVRELPRDCVHVYEKTPDGLVIKHPPFETFGGDIQRISSYVFGDKSVSKPFEELLRKKLAEYGSAEALLAALGEHVNEEMIIQISAMDAGKW